MRNLANDLNKTTHIHYPLSTNHERRITSDESGLAGPVAVLHKQLTDMKSFAYWRFMFACWPTSGSPCTLVVQGAYYNIFSNISQKKTAKNVLFGVITARHVPANAGNPTSTFP
ncbi:MAG: hypothetical protein ACYSR9_07395 [Planctomycetota bacterium]